MPRQALPKMSGPGARQMAGRKGTRAVTGPVLPRCIYAAAKDRRTRTPECSRDLWHLVPCGVGNVAHDRGRSQASGSCHRFPGGAAHVGAEPPFEPSLMMPVIIIYLILNEQLRLIFHTSPAQNELACPAELLDDASHRFCFKIRAANFRWSSWGRLFPLQKARFHESLDGTMTNTTNPSRFIQADSFRISECASLAGNRMVFARRCHAVLIPAISFAGGVTHAIQY